MKQVFPMLVLFSSSLPAIAHEGHGVDAGSALHFFSGAHLLLPISAGIVAGVVGLLAFKRLRERR